MRFLCHTQYNYYKVQTEDSRLWFIVRKVFTQVSVHAEGIVRMKSSGLNVIMMIKGVVMLLKNAT